MGTDPVPASARVTLNEVAEAAGVSRAAASLALRGKPGVAEETRRRVLDVAGELGYKIRPYGLPLTTGTVGLVVKSKPADMGSTNAFYAPVVAGLTRACTELELDLRLESLAVDEHFDPVEVPRMIHTPDVDGLVILGTYLSRRTCDMIGSQPLVLVDGYAEEPHRYPSVVSDNAGGTEQATRHLIELGHRHIVMVGTTTAAFPSILDRRNGYRAAMIAAGLEPLLVDARHDDPALCATELIAFLTTNPRVSAVVAANDAVAFALLAELRGRVPGEISLVGFDDIEAADLIRPRLTTVRVDKQAMGRLALSMLRHRIANPGDPSFVLIQQAELVVRETTAPPP